jgi:hypothetical protein
MYSALRTAEGTTEVSSEVAASFVWCPLCLLDEAGPYLRAEAELFAGLHDVVQRHVAGTAKVSGGGAPW